MANLNTALTPAPVITVVNKDGSTASGYTGNVTMALATNPSNATLGGTTTVAASAGVATFSNLTLNRSGKNFTLRATAAAQGGYTPKAKVSGRFTIATRLVFTVQPTGVNNPDDILPGCQVTVQDTAGNTDTAYNGEITVALYTGAGNGILSGFTTRTAVAGVASFSGLSIDAEGDYSLRATAESVTTAYDPAPVISNTFAIGSYVVNFSLSDVDASVPEYFTNTYGIAPPANASLTVNIDAGVILSTTTNDGTPALLWGDTSVWTGTPTFTLNVGTGAQILGCGGNGGDGADAPSATVGADGGDGGAAIELGGNTVSINNLGYIFGGGGGGGGGGGIHATSAGNPCRASGGGGGQGAGQLPIGGGTAPASTVTSLWGISQEAADGTSQSATLNRLQVSVAGGAGSVLLYNASPSDFANGGAGGASGNYGEAGLPGVAASTSEVTAATYAPGAGGAAGLAIDLGGGSVTWIAGNNGTQVKGAVA